MVSLLFTLLVSSASGNGFFEAVISMAALK